jgi:hypothetical protein
MRYFSQKAVLIKNITVTSTPHNFFHQGPYCGDISLDVKCPGIFKTVREKNQFAYLTRQVYSENRTSLYEANFEATQKPHGYLLLDLSQDINVLFRFITKIFASDITVVYDALENE